MPRAFVLIREAPWYRKQAFAQGLKKAGYEVLLRGPDRARVGDVVLIWNRYNATHDMAARFERDGGTVLVAENGYLNGDGGSPKFAVHPRGPKPADYYAIGVGFHNDESRVIAGGPERWAALGVVLKPWRTDGEHVLVCPNRGFGVPERVMHPDWADLVAQQIRKVTKRPVRIRRHPGNDAPKRSLAEDLRGAWCTVIWSSSSGVHALVEGIPVICCAPYWIAKAATTADVTAVDAPPLLDREAAFRRLACGQWQLQEIESGEPFAHLLPAAG